MNLVELKRSMTTLRLSGMAGSVETRILEAQTDKMAPLDFASALVSDELTRRSDRFIKRRLKQAEFRDPNKTLDAFDFDFNKKMNRRLLFELATGQFVDRHEDALFLGPPGTGKSHIAQALAHLAIRAGAEARFTKTSRVLAHLAGGRADRTWDKRLAELTRPAVLLLDDFGMRELTAPQADDLYELITERAGKSLILTSNRAPVDWYPLFPNPVVAESLLDRLINNSHQCFMNGPSYRPNKSPSRVVPTGNTSAS